MPLCSIRHCLLALICIWELKAGLAGAGLSPAQREQMRSQIREYRQEFPVSPEERQQRREAMRERWEKMSPEERQLLRERIQEHHRQREERYREGPP